MKNSIRILGIDCGTAITGWSVMDKVNNSSPDQDSHLGRTAGIGLRGMKLIECGIIKTHKLANEDERLKVLGDSIIEILEEFSPQHLAIEDIFFNKNVKTVIKVSQARGVVLYHAMAKGLECFHYTPLQVKQHIVGYGRAEKSQVIKMVNDLLKLPRKIVQDDMADAVAVSYCHASQL